MGIGERLARMESAQEWTRIILGLIGAFMIGGFAFLGVQINRLDTKIDALGDRIDAQGAPMHQEIEAINARISAESATTRQELIGIANAIANSITAARKVPPQIVVVPMPAMPTPGTPPPATTPKSPK